MGDITAKCVFSHFKKSQYPTFPSRKKSHVKLHKKSSLERKKSTTIDEKKGGEEAAAAPNGHDCTKKKAKTEGGEGRKSDDK